MIRLLIIPLIIIALMCGAVVWSGGSKNNRADFTFIAPRDIITLDINQMSTMQDIRLTYAIREGLYAFNGETLEPEPAVAKSVDVSPDKLVYTFHIRPDARWSNGDPVTAKDFLFSWKRQLDTPGEYSYLHYYIKGAEAYVNRIAKHERPDFSTVGEEAIDDHTLRVTLHDPVPFIFDLMAYTPFYPLHERSMEKFKNKDVDPLTGVVTYNQKFTRPPDVVTNGPFNFVEWDFKRSIRLEKNPYYWDRDKVKSKTIEMEIIEDPLTQILRYDSGGVDWLGAVPSEVAPEMLETGRKDFHNFGGYGTEYLCLMLLPKHRNGDENPLADLRIRKALAMSIDKEFIVKNITRMGEVPTTTFIPPTIYKSLGWQSTPGLPYDPAQARKLLAEAGYPNGGELPGVKFLYRTGSQVGKDMAQNLVQQWKRELNVIIPLTSMEPKSVRESLNKKDFSICVSDWIGDYADPSTFTDLYQSSSANNNTGWASPEYDKFLADAGAEIDTQKRLRLLEQAERKLIDDVPIVPLFVLTNQYLFRSNVHGLNLQPRNTVMFKGVHVDR